MLELPKSLWANRRLLKDFVVRDLKSRYVGSSMGFFWSVIYPIVSLFIYMFVFRKVLGARWSDKMPESDTALVMLCGILVWAAFAETLARSANAMIENANLIKKVVFPSEILPAYLTISSIVNMTIGLPVLLAGVVWFGYLSTEDAAGDANARAGRPCDVEVALLGELSLAEFQVEDEPEIKNPQAQARGFTQQEDVPLSLKLGVPLIVLPLLYVLQTLFTIGLGSFLATLNVFLRDTAHLVGVLTMVWMFATPIFYPARLVIGGGFGWMLEINPMYWLIESYRNVLLWGAWPDWALLARFAVVAVVVFFLGTRFLSAQKARFPDLL